MFVFDVQAANIELPTTHVLTGQVALDRLNALAGKLQSTQLGQLALGTLQESYSIHVCLCLRMVFR